MTSVHSGTPSWIMIAFAFSCAPTTTAPTAAPATPSADAGAAAAAPAPALDGTVGGRLFDKWYADQSYAGDFKPDDKRTPAPDGNGGPSGNGTLHDGAGEPILNTGHDYRLKNLFGWDLKGTEGIYGPDYQNKSTAVSVNLLTDNRTEDELRAWLAAGDENIPALGDVLDEAQLAAIAKFVVGVRSKQRPHPDQVFSLSKEAPNNYRLVSGGDASIGVALVEDRCGCHGTNGTDIELEGKYSLGNYARTKGYEAWFKIANGQPGTAMGAEVDTAADVLNIMAALCDRTVFPANDAKDEVADGDPRCGTYLK